MKTIILFSVLVVQSIYGFDTSENEHLSKDCNKGNIEACLKFGNIYYHGVYNGAYDRSYYKVVVKPYEKACKHGKGKACYNLGDMYLVGRGVTIYPPKGYQLYKKACDLNYSSGCSQLGFFYREGMGLPQDYKKALELYKKACTLQELVNFPQSSSCVSRDELLKLKVKKVKRTKVKKVNK